MRGTSLREEGREEQPQPGRAAGDAVAAILQTWEGFGVGKWWENDRKWMEMSWIIYGKWVEFFLSELGCEMGDTRQIYANIPFKCPSLWGQPSTKMERNCGIFHLGLPEGKWLGSGIFRHEGVRGYTAVACRGSQVQLAADAVLNRPKIKKCRVTARDALRMV